VNDPLIVSILKRVADLGHDFQRRLGWKSAGIEKFAYVFAVHVLHAEKVEAIDLTEVENRDNVGMVEVGQRAGLAGEALGKRRVACHLGRQDLHGYQPIEFSLPCLIDSAHSALA